LGGENDPASKPAQNSDVSNCSTPPCCSREIRHVLRQHLKHYNNGRPHRGINLEVPMPARVSTVTAPTTGCVVERVDVHGGLIHEYRHAA
jgi:hypothetical protein